jgi:hypothetical protein
MSMFTRFVYGEQGSCDEDEREAKYLQAFEFLKSLFSERYHQDYDKFKEIEGI